MSRSDPLPGEGYSRAVGGVSADTLAPPGPPSAAMRRDERGRFEELDAFRGLAALSVVLFHYTRHGTRYFSGYPVDFWPGEYGVHLFFVISGFVIYFTLERSRTVGGFAFSRFSRLYPSYWAALAFLFVLDVVLRPAQLWWHGYLVNVTMFQRFIGYPDVDNVYWTLAIELAFYLIMAAVFSLGLMRRIAALGFAWMIAALAWTGAQVSGAHVPSWMSTLANTYLILPYAPYFLAGVMFYLIHSRGVRLRYAAVIVLAWGSAALAHGFTAGWVTLVIFGAFALAVAGRLTIIVNPVTLWLGAISYPLYLVHRNPGYAFLDWMYARHASYLLSFAIALAGSLAVAHLVSTLIERPAMRLLRKWYRHDRWHRMVT